MVKQLSTAEIEAGMPPVQESPKDGGTVVMIVARPATDDRLVLEQGEFSLENGLEGDNWRARGSATSDTQITIMNARFLDLIAGTQDRWALAGDQLIVDLDLGKENLETGQRLQMGSAVFEVTAVPHTGCNKFLERYGRDALKFANSDIGKAKRLRGVYLKVIQPGTVAVGDTITKI
jgi:MOSC domain-containing protein YiiM